MAKKWRFAPAPDAQMFPEGRYILAQTPDEFGSRVFTSVHLRWEEENHCFLDDAASFWGRAPWALTEARLGMKLSDLGSWGDFCFAKNKPVSWILKARDQDKTFFGISTLMLARSALRLDAMGASGLSLESARAALRQEIARDEHIHAAKKKAFMDQNPDWKVSQFTEAEGPPGSA